MAVPHRGESCRYDAIIALFVTILVVATTRELLVHQRVIRHYVGDEFNVVSQPSHGSHVEHNSFQTSLVKLSQRQRVQHILQRLSRFDGRARGSVRIVHACVAMIGILGMFSAILGALVAPWLNETGDDGLEEDRFSYWVTDEDDQFDDRCCGVAREQRYWLVRLLDSP
ncbi:hypothetical protein FGB62_82g063 [Gracilaria domingensis]|nr:hypothetical protein FGB62_82g063 [Gracilaria domingensis]